MNTENPWLFIVCFTLCWPSPLAIIITFLLARHFELRVPFVRRGDYDA